MDPFDGNLSVSINPTTQVVVAVRNYLWGTISLVGIYRKIQMKDKLFLLFLVLFAPSVGCSGNGSFKGVDVSGTVLIDGKPLEGVEVYFFTDKFEGFGKTNANGKYQLVSGALPGPNKIYFKKANPDAVSGIDMSIPGMDAGQVAAMAEAKDKADSGGKKRATSISLVPPEYSDPKTTKLSFPVPAGGTSNADFKISSK